MKILEHLVYTYRIFKKWFANRTTLSPQVFEGSASSEVSTWKNIPPRRSTNHRGGRCWSRLGRLSPGQKRNEGLLRFADSSNNVSIFFPLHFTITFKKKKINAPKIPSIKKIRRYTLSYLYKCYFYFTNRDRNLAPVMQRRIVQNLIVASREGKGESGGNGRKEVFTR